MGQKKMNEKNYRVLVSIQSRWLAEMIRRALRKEAQLELVVETLNKQSLESALATSNPDWLILDQPGAEGMPDLIEDMLGQHPSLRILVISEDAARARVEKSGAPPEYLAEVSLTHIVARLRAANGTGERQ